MKEVDILTLKKQYPSEEQFIEWALDLETMFEVEEDEEVEA